MRAGTLRHRIALQSASSAQSDYTGQPTKTWSTYKTVYARVQPLSGREAFYAAQTRPDVTHTITLRYNSSITPEHRALWGSRIFQFESVLTVDEIHHEMRIMAKEAV